MTELTQLEFEKWIVFWASGYSLQKWAPSANCGTYRELDTEALWKAWQAGRSSLESENARLREALEMVIDAIPSDIPLPTSKYHRLFGALKRAEAAIRGGTNV